MPKLGMPGKVYIVGAGPGDPGLLTLKGKRCLAEADVVVCDYLANPRLLDFTPADCRRILVGKHGGGEKVDQEVINDLLVEQARAGRTVVRLKGGDPLVFGRGGEEMEILRRAGVDFEVVPGVSAVTAVPAYAGIPLTHRELASNVVITTGYEYPGKHEEAVRWDELARTGSTLVILMTTRQLKSNMDKLLAGGMAPSTPAAVIEWGTRADQRTIAGTIATLAALAQEAGVKPPAVAVVGEVVGLRPKLKWIERKPLFGRRIVLTRPRHQAEDFARLLENQGAEVVSFPTIETAAVESIRLVDEAVGRAQEFDWLLFTSANGVRVFFDRLRRIGSDVRVWHRARIAAIGPQTAAELERLGLRVELVPDDYRAEGVIESLARLGVAGRRILLPRAAGAREVLPVRLRELGAVVEEIATYESVRPRAEMDEIASLLTDGSVDAITFTSSSTVHNFAALAGDSLAALTAHVAIACIGPITAKTAESHGLRVAIQPSTYTVAALAESLVEHFSGHARRRLDGDDA